MDKYAQLRDALQNVFGGQGVFLTTAKFISRQDDTCTVEVDGLQLSRVRMRATKKTLADKLLIVPADGSDVLIGSLSGDLKELAVLGMDSAARIEYTNGDTSLVIDAATGKITLNGGLLGGLVNIQDLVTNLNSVKAFAEAMNQAVPAALTALGSIGTGAVTAYNSAMAAKAITIKDMEDKNVTH